MSSGSAKSQSFSYDCGIVWPYSLFFVHIFVCFGWMGWVEGGYIVITLF